MELVVLAFFTAFGKVWLLVLCFGLRNTLRWRKVIEIFFAIVLPILLLGTFHGAILAIFSGLWLTVMLTVLNWLPTRQPRTRARCERMPRDNSFP